MSKIGSSHDNVVYDGQLGQQSDKLSEGKHLAI